MPSFKDALINTDWSKVTYYCQLNSPDFAYKEFINEFGLLYDHCFPVKTLSVNKKSPKHPWMTKLLIYATLFVKKTAHKWKKQTNEIV